MPSFHETDLSATSLACARALADMPDLQVELVGGDVACLRHAADTEACHARFGLSEEACQMRPEGVAGRVFEALAEARAETLGARWLPGIASNLANCRSVATPEERLRAWAWDAYRGAPTPDCPPTLRDGLAGLRLDLDEPGNYARQARLLSMAWAEAFLADAEARGAAAEQASSQAPGQKASPKEEDQDTEGTPEAAERTGNSSPGVMPPPMPDALVHHYKIYTTRDDRVVQAHELAAPRMLAVLRARLDGELAPYRHMVTRLAHQLQRLIVARQRRHWALDQEEGVVDPSRLARLVADPGRAHIFRMEQEGPFRQTAVTLLIDNSGSMRGHPILVAALTADILTRSLERCGIKVEVLGYTTADGDGSSAQQQWVQAGRPAAPGRLNALRHVVYKAMDTPWRRSRHNMGVMLKDDLLKENIDGEALAWACQRLLGRSEPRRLLIVISDGAPMDKATLAANSRDFLERHLHQVVAWIGKRTNIELHAIGIGHQVGRYYPDSVSLSTVDELGAVLLKRLGTWLA